MVSGSVAEERFEQSMQLDSSPDPFSGSEIEAQREAMHSPVNKVTGLPHIGETSELIRETMMSASLPNLSRPAQCSYQAVTKRTLALSQSLVLRYSTADNNASKEGMKSSWKKKVFLV